MENDGLRDELDRLRGEVEELRERLSAMAANRRIFAAGPAGDIVAMAPGRRPQRLPDGGTALVVWRPTSY